MLSSPLYTERETINNYNIEDGVRHSDTKNPNRKMKLTSTILPTHKHTHTYAYKDSNAYFRIRIK